MKKLISIIILISIAAVSAQAKFGMQMRLRSEMQNLNSTDADKQVYDRQVDVRLRPDISYTVNDYLSVKLFSRSEIFNMEARVEPVILTAKTLRLKISSSI